MYPDGKQFAFTILDDTDDATKENVAPIYRFLNELGMRTTKTVWPLPKSDGQESLFDGSSDLSDKDYLEFVHWLTENGFELTWHGPAMESSDRRKIELGLRDYKQKIGKYPYIHVNHSRNRDNLYWGPDRFDSKMIKRILSRVKGYQDNYYQGNVRGSDYFWGDLAEKHFKFCRSFSLPEINSLNVCKQSPYHDPKRNEIDYWFVTSDASAVTQFEGMFTRNKIARLISEQGMCIVSTHLGKGFCEGGEVKSSIKSILEDLASKNGWFVPVGEMLDWRISMGFGKPLSAFQRRLLEYRWLISTIKARYLR